LQLSALQIVSSVQAIEPGGGDCGGTLKAWHLVLAACSSKVFSLVFALGPGLSGLCALGIDIGKRKIEKDNLQQPLLQKCTHLHMLDM
jgi:hypothetical protein